MHYDEYLAYIAQQQDEEILITNHPECITLGKNASSADILTKGNIPIFKSNRGGGATYHDHGQIVLYPRINLRLRKITLQSYIEILEEWGIKTLASFNIKAYPTTQPGLWHEGHKIAFIGLAVQNGFSQHGISFNLTNCKIENFAHIIPCRNQTFVSKLDINLQDFAQQLIAHCPFPEIKIHQSITITES